MTMNPDTNTITRREVAKRIDRFLTSLNRANRMPNRREVFWLREALTNLQEGQHLAADEATRKAEALMPIREHAAQDLTSNIGATVEQLRAQFDLIMQDEL
jgi:hypothetical protein